MNGPTTNGLGGPDGRGGPHVFVDDLGAPALSDDDRHHLERVLRLRPGDALTVSDGAGAWRTCRIGPVVEVTSDVFHERRREPAISVGFAPVKGDRPEWVVQKLTELGTDRILVLHTERAVVRWDGERAVRHLAKLDRVAREAAMQCRRCHLPVVEGAVDVSDLAGHPGVVRADLGGEAPSLEHTTVLIGPEGGWSDGEREMIPRSVSLADHVLRAETAAVTASALYNALRAERVGPTTHQHRG